MIVVDTSVWVAVQRKPVGADADTLRSLLDAGEVALALPVRLQLLSGTPKKDRGKVRRAFSALPLAVPTEETWELIESWVPTAADAGYRFDLADLLIAGITSDLGGLVWSFDKDFAVMEKLGFVNRY